MTAEVALHDLAALYRDLHAHPELSFQERRTAGLVAQRLRTLGYQVSTGVGGTGVVGVLGHGRGPTALLRADMDALPVREQTGLPYASTLRGVDADGHDVPVMHACGHDMHVACLLGACQVLAEHCSSWSGRLLRPGDPFLTGPHLTVRIRETGREAVKRCPPVVCPVGAFEDSRSSGGVRGPA